MQQFFITGFLMDYAIRYDLDELYQIVPSHIIRCPGLKILWSLLLSNVFFQIVFKTIWKKTLLSRRDHKNIEICIKKDNM